MDRNPKSRAVQQKACLSLDWVLIHVRFQKRTKGDFKQHTFFLELGSSVGRWPGRGMESHKKLVKKTGTFSQIRLYSNREI